jgi:iron complex transport system substrate-binding protein
VKKRIGIVVVRAAGAGRVWGKDTGSADTGVGDTDVATGGRLFKTADEETANSGRTRSRACSRGR